MAMIILITLDTRISSARDYKNLGKGEKLSKGKKNLSERFTFGISSFMVRRGS